MFRVVPCLLVAAGTSRGWYDPQTTLARTLGWLQLAQIQPILMACPLSLHQSRQHYQGPVAVSMLPTTTSAPSVATNDPKKLFHIVKCCYKVDLYSGHSLNCVFSLGFLNCSNCNQKPSQALLLLFICTDGHSTI